MSKYFLPKDIARCARVDCPKHQKCARWLDRLPWGQYWYNNFTPENCEGFIKKKEHEDKLHNIR